MIDGILLAQAVVFSILSGIVVDNNNRSALAWGVLDLLFGVFAFIAAIAVGEDKPERTVFPWRDRRNVRHRRL